MKRILAITTAALMGASMLASPVLAQSDKESQTGGQFNASDSMTDSTPEVDDGAAAASGSGNLEDKEYQTGGQHNASGSMTGTDAELDTGTTAEMDDTAPANDNESYETGGQQNATDSMSGSGVDTETTAAIGSTFDGALSAIGNNSTNAESLGSMTEVSSVNVVSVGELEGSDPALVDQAVTDNQDGVDELRASIEANQALSQELETQGVDASSVIGAELGVDGEVTVYTM